MSSQDPNVPKRRSSAANRRRRKQLGTVAPQAEAQETVQQAKVAPVPAETADRNQQRRDERRAAKTQSQKRGVSKVVDTERLSGVQKFYHDTMSEIRKVNWPTREQTLNLTVLVIALSLVMGLLLGGIDFVLLRLFEAVG